jgi:hypothetical protein
VVQTWIKSHPTGAVGLLLIAFVAYVGLASSVPGLGRMISTFTKRWFSAILLFLVAASKAVQTYVAFAEGKSDDWLFPSFVAVVMVAAAGNDAAKAYQERDKSHRDGITELVNRLSVEVAKRTGDQTLRVNLMVVTGEVLQVVAASYKQRKHTQWDIGQGVCGIAAERKEPTVHSLDILADAIHFDQIVDPNHGGTPWRISRAHWEASKRIRSVFSLPIYRVTPGRQVAAVLNLDSQLTAEAAGFSREQIVTVVETMAGQIQESLFKTTWV